MTKIYTIGANGKTPKTFFELIKKNNIELVIDIRLNYNSQLAGYAKGGDDYLGYFLGVLGNSKYVHDSCFAPTKELLDNYHKNKDWGYYEEHFSKIIKERDFKEYFEKNYSQYNSVCFLCAEEEPDHCHRRLVAESITKAKEIVHL